MTFKKVAFVVAGFLAILTPAHAATVTRTVDFSADNFSILPVSFGTVPTDPVT